MEENFNVFYCTVCHVCKSSTYSQEGAKFCSGCRLVQYCSNAHQKLDWPSHKQFCKSVQKILSKTGGDHVYGQEDKTVNNEVSWDKERSNATLLMVGLLQRPLSTVESQILLFPPVCNFCHLYKPNKMIPCRSCLTVLYCCLEHKHKDKAHLNFCPVLRDSFHVDMLRYFDKSDSVLCSLDFPDSEPESMEDIMRKEKGLMKENKLLLSEPLSFSLTIVFAVKMSKVHNNLLKVHIIGADLMEVKAVLTFPAIFHFLQYLRRLDVVLVGPSLPSNLDVEVPVEISDKCSVTVSNQVYHDFIKTNNYFTPDIIVVFNCGFCEYLNSPQNDAWKDTLPCILGVQNSIVAITSYSCSEARDDLNRLRSMKKNDINFNALVNFEINPFCSLYPHRDWESKNDDVFYVNKYISILKSE